MSTKEEIEQSIRNNFSIIFGKSDPVDFGAFQRKYNALVDYAATVSAPFLGAETIRYQSMLLYVSVLFLSVSLFWIGRIRIGESLVSVDRNLLVIYAVFIGAVIVVFLTKAYVDYQRARFVRARNDEVLDEAVSELQGLITIAFLRRRIQQYFWQELSDAIGRSYQPYADAVAAALNKQPNFEHIPMRVWRLDRTALSENPDTKAEIARQDEFLAGLVAALTDDEKRFREKAEIILSTAQARSEDPGMSFSDSYQNIRAAYEQCLSKWSDARDDLASEELHLAVKNMGNTSEVVGTEAMVRVLKRIRTIRRIYAALEIAAPVALAIFAILYVGFLHGR
jgi:hypothetical protein